MRAMIKQKTASMLSHLTLKRDGSRVGASMVSFCGPGTRPTEKELLRLGVKPCSRDFRYDKSNRMLFLDRDGKAWFWAGEGAPKFLCTLAGAGINLTDAFIRFTGQR